MTEPCRRARTAEPGRRQLYLAATASAIVTVLAAAAYAQPPGETVPADSGTAPTIAVPTAPDRQLERFPRSLNRGKSLSPCVPTPITCPAVSVATETALCDRLDGRYAEAINRRGARFARCASASQAPVRYRVSACAAADGAVPVETFADASCRDLKQAWCRDIANRHRAIKECRDRAQAEPAEQQRSVELSRAAPRWEAAGKQKPGDPAAPLAVLDLPVGPIGQGGLEMPPPPTPASPPPTFPPAPLAAANLDGCWTASLERADFREVLTYCLEEAGAVYAEISALGTYRHPETGETTLFSATCPTGGRYRRESDERFVIESFAASCTWTGRDTVLRRARFAEDMIACTLIAPDEAHCLRRDRSGDEAARPEPLIMTR